GLPGLPSTMSRALLALALSELGEFDEAIPIGDDAIRIAEAAGRPYTLTIALFAAGSVAALRGNLLDAIPLLERSLDLAQTWDLHLHVGHVSYRLGCTLLMVGRVAEGQRLLKQARQHQEQRGNRLHLAITLAWLARAYDLEDGAEGLDLARR